jgi:magnesium transporter
MSRLLNDRDLDEILDNLHDLIRQDRASFALPFIGDLHPSDIAEILSHLNEEERNTIFSLLPPETGSEVLAELGEHVVEDILEKMDNRQIAEMVNEMDSDDAADILSDLSPVQTAEILEHVEEENSEEIQELLLYPEDTAGGIMAKEFVAVPGSATVQQAIDEIRKKHEEIEHIFYCFVVNGQGNLMGAVSLHDLILAGPETKVQDISDSDLISIDVQMDQEEVARIFKKYDLVVAPVVNKRNKLLGRITVDDIVDVINEEIEEDLGLIAGTGEEEVMEDSIVQITRARLPWLILSFVGQIIAAFIMKHFEGTIEQIIVSTFFIPMVMAMGGSVGQQSSVIVVRGLATGEISFGGTWQRLKKEVLVAVLNGIVLGSLIFVIIFLWDRDMLFGMLLAISLLIIILNASLFGAVVPILFKKLEVDPALATGPFVATFNDVIGLLIYFSLLTVGFNYFL